MKIEDRLQDAMHGYADGIEPEGGSWTRIAARFDDAPSPRRPSRRPLVLVGAALAVVVVLIGGFLIRDRADDTEVTTQPSGVATTTPGPVGAPPTGVLVATRAGRLSVLGSQDGDEHSSLGSFTDPLSLSTSPDGRQVYFQTTGSSGACGNDPGPNLDRLIPEAEASTLLIGGVVSPTVSPDGKWVAYGTWCDGRTLGFTNIASGGNSRSNPLGGTQNEADPSVETVEPLAWSPDSQRLLYRLGLKGEQEPRYYVGRLWPAVPQAETEVVELPRGWSFTAGAFIDDGTLAMAGESDTGAGVWSFDLRTKNQELMFSVPSKVISLVADRTGRHFLAVTPGGDLYRWSVGDEGPTKLAAGVTAATWLPWS